MEGHTQISFTDKKRTVKSSFFVLNKNAHNVFDFAMDILKYYLFLNIQLYCVYHKK